MLIKAPPARLQPVDVETMPYPGFPTDLQQPPLVAAMSTADGTSVVRETIFDRFRYIDELRRMGADIKTERGDCNYSRCQTAHRGHRWKLPIYGPGAALAVAALAAEGRTDLYGGVEILDRGGYEFFEDKLRRLGGQISAGKTPAEHKNGPNGPFFVG